MIRASTTVWDAVSTVPRTVRGEVGARGEADRQALDNAAAHTRSRRSIGRVLFFVTAILLDLPGLNCSVAHNCLKVK
jgi:hypothetical protein